MALIKTYEIGKEARYSEIDVEFERQWHEVLSQANVRNRPTIDRLILGLGSVIFGVVMIVHAVVS